MFMATSNGWSYNLLHLLNIVLGITCHMVSFLPFLSMSRFPFSFLYVIFVIKLWFLSHWVSIHFSTLNLFRSHARFYTYVRQILFKPVNLEAYLVTNTLKYYDSDNKYTEILVVTQLLSVYIPLRVQYEYMIDTISFCVNYTYSHIKCGRHFKMTTIPVVEIYYLVPS